MPLGPARLVKQTASTSPSGPSPPIGPGCIHSIVQGQRGCEEVLTEGQGIGSIRTMSLHVSDSPSCCLRWRRVGSFHFTAGAYARVLLRLAGPGQLSESAVWSLRSGLVRGLMPNTVGPWSGRNQQEQRPPSMTHTPRCRRSGWYVWCPSYFDKSSTGAGLVVDH